MCNTAYCIFIPIIIHDLYHYSPIILNYSLIKMREFKRRNQIFSITSSIDKFSSSRSFAAPSPHRPRQLFCRFLYIFRNSGCVKLPGTNCVDRMSRSDSTVVTCTRHAIPDRMARVYRPKMASVGRRFGSNSSFHLQIKYRKLKKMDFSLKKSIFLISFKAFLFMQNDYITIIIINDCYI